VAAALVNFLIEDLSGYSECRNEVGFDWCRSFLERVSHDSRYHGTLITTIRWLPFNSNRALRTAARLLCNMW
jgi:hypothetical protein